MKVLLAVGLGLVLMGGCVEGRGGGLPVEFVRRAMRGTVTVVAYDPDRAMPSLGSGFFVGGDRVATARHVLAGADRAEIRTIGGQTIAVSGIVAEDRTMDVVVVQLARAASGAEILQVARDRPEVGQRVVAVGSPLGLEWSVSDGMVSAIREIPEAGRALQHTVAVSPGSSGGPLLNVRGEVVAIQTGCITTDEAHVIQAGQSLNFAVPAERFKELKARPSQALAEARKEIPAGWSPVVTRHTDLAGLRPLTRDDFAGSLAFFQERAREEPGEPDAWFRVGLCQERIGKHAEAIEAYGKAVSLKEDFAVAWNNLGAIYNGQRRYAEAADALQRAVGAKADYTEAYNSLAVAYLGLDRYTEAVQAAAEAVRLNPKHAAAQHNLGRAYLKGGDREKALKQYEVLLKLDRNAAGQLRSEIDRNP